MVDGVGDGVGGNERFAGGGDGLGLSGDSGGDGALSSHLSLAPADLMLAPILRELGDAVPGFRLVRKRESWLCKYVFAPVLWCVGRKKFLDEEPAITIGKTVYASAALIETPALLARVLVHEGVHLVRSGAGAVFAAWIRTAWWTARYLCPQAVVLVVLSVAAGLLCACGVSPYFALATLAFLGPWGASFRVDEEARAYGAELAFSVWISQGMPDGAAPTVVPEWSGSAARVYAAALAGWPYYRAARNVGETAGMIEEYALRARAHLRVPLGSLGAEWSAAEYRLVERVGTAVRAVNGEWAAAQERAAKLAASGGAA